MIMGDGFLGTGVGLAFFETTGGSGAEINSSSELGPSSSSASSSSSTGVEGRVEIRFRFFTVSFTLIGVGFATLRSQP